MYNYTLHIFQKEKKNSDTLMMAIMASVFRVGWCLISSSIAVPRLEAVSPERQKTEHEYSLLIQH